MIRHSIMIPEVVPIIKWCVTVCDEVEQAASERRTKRTNESKKQKRHYYCHTRAHDDAWNVASMNEAHTS
jgi:hypothetical protein